jgi:hypothetical protein
MYPEEPRPVIVDVRERLRVEVDTWPSKLGAEINPAAW